MGDILKSSILEHCDLENPESLVKQNYLGEFNTEDEKSVVRENLGVFAKESTYSKEETDAKIQEILKSILKNYVTSTELPQAISELTDEIANAGYVKSDGTVPFTNAQTQSALPTSDDHLTNKIYVDNLLKAHINANDPHKILDKISGLLAQYAKLSDVYTKQSTYQRKEIDCLLTNKVSKDGSIPFIKPQIGVDPTLPSHLATARYVQKVMQDHNNELDPHDFQSTLKRVLSNYYTKSETYTKAQTYSRSQLLEIVKSNMKDVIDQAITTHLAKDGSVSELKDYILNELYKYVKIDGSVAHTNPQPGVAAVNPNEFVVLEQLQTELEKAVEKLKENIKNATNQTTWIPSGPVRTTVGFVEDNSVMPKEMTVQQVCDAIFYGRRLGIEAPEYAEYGENVCIKILAHGLGTLTEATIYKNGEVLGTLSPSDFINDPEKGIYYEYCNTGEFTKDTEWKVVFHYSDNKEITEKATTKLSYPIFIGMVPYWWNVQEDVTIESLRRLVAEDPENCKFFTHLGKDIKELTAKYKFEDPKKRSLVIVTPDDYPSISKLTSPTQSVEKDAFVEWKQPMYPNNAKVGVVYKIFVYNQSLVKLDQSLKFNFEPNTKNNE